MVYQCQVVARTLLLENRAVLIELFRRQAVALPMHLEIQDNTVEREAGVVGEMQGEPENRLSAKGACRVLLLAVRRVPHPSNWNTADSGDHP